MANKCFNSKQARELFTPQELKRIKSQNLTPEEMVDFVKGFQNKKVLDIRQGIMQARKVETFTKFIEDAPAENMKNHLDSIVFQDRTGKVHIPGGSLENQN